MSNMTFSLQHESREYRIKKNLRRDSGERRGIVKISSCTFESRNEIRLKSGGSIYENENKSLQKRLVVGQEFEGARLFDTAL